jgi:TonB family protein
MGVLRGGKLVDDRYVPEKGEVSVGSSAKNTVALLGSNLPKEHVLFTFHKKHPVLHVLDGMTGELAVDGTTREPLDKLKARGTKDATGWSIELPDTVRGWVSVGDATFFVQVGQKPPPPPKRTLPKEARTGVMGGIETLFVGILVAVASFEGVAVLAVHQRKDVPLDQASPEDLDRFADIMMPEKPKEEPKKEDDEAKNKAEEEARKKAEEEARKKDEEKKKDEEAKQDEKPDPEKAAKAEAERKAKMRDAVAKKGVLSVLGTAGGAGGALANVFSASAGFTDDVGAALAGAGGVLVATGNDSAARKGGGGSGGQVGIGDLSGTVSGGGGRAVLEEKKKVAPQIAFDSDDVEVESSSLDKESLNKFIRLRIKSVQACYEQQLKRNPSLKGKIVVRFVVTSAGRVGDVSVESNSMGDREVEACITQLIRRWTFPFKPEEDAPVSFPFVFSPGG